jgi:hypothetical protein
LNQFQFCYSGPEQIYFKTPQIKRRKGGERDGKSYAPPRAKFHAEMRYFVEITGKFSGTYVALKNFKYGDGIKASTSPGASEGIQ